MKKIIPITIILLLFTYSNCFAQLGLGGSIGRRDHVPQPRLIEPITDKVDLTGKDMLEFKWSPHEAKGMPGKYYDLRLYKGYEMVEGTLIFKKRLSGREYKVEVESDVFENGQVYTWSLRLGYRGGDKSVRSTQSFKIIK
ncbi:hypothetical protein HQ584_07775 [Patescibacteria group bacterium]|nr:hypothetical protein [Patescibacteria group bacterium]